MDTSLLDGRAAIVTGASRGIGAATAKALDRAGARVAIVGRHRDTLSSLARELQNGPVIVEVDLVDPEAPTTIANEALAAFGQVDILVNNAAAAARMPFEETEAALIDEMLAVNVRAPLLLIRLLLESMKGRGSGSIVNVSSLSGIVGTPKRAAYAASKGAMDAATRSLAAELGPFGIRVNSVAPGVVDTELWAKNKAIPGVIEEVVAQTPLRRWGAPEDIADVIAFLASDAARFVTGQTIAVDGGMAHTLDLYSGPV